MMTIRMKPHDSIVSRDPGSWEYCGTHACTTCRMLIYQYVA